MNVMVRVWLYDAQQSPNQQITVVRVVTSIRLNSNPPVEKVQILSFPTPFRTSQYLIFSPTQRTLKAHRKMSKNLQEISRWAGILLSIK